MNRELHVYLDQVRIGTLFENQGIWSFKYEQSWVETGRPLGGIHHRTL